MASELPRTWERDNWMLAWIWRKRGVVSIVVRRRVLKAVVRSWMPSRASVESDAERPMVSKVVRSVASVGRGSLEAAAAAATAAAVLAVLAVAAVPCSC